MIKKVVQKLNFDVIQFRVQEKGFNKIEVKNNKCINVFVYEDGLVFSIYVSDETFGDSIDLLVLIDHDNQCRNRIQSSLFQFSNKKSNKSEIPTKKFFLINFTHD